MKKVEEMNSRKSDNNEEEEEAQVKEEKETKKARPKKDPKKRLHEAERRSPCPKSTRIVTENTLGTITSHSSQSDAR